MLLQAVEEVARLARPADPEHVAQRPWDRARSLSTRFVDALPARRIAEYLGLSWPEVLRIALLPPRPREHALGHHAGEERQDWLTDEYIAFVLRLIATRLGVLTLTPAQYVTERARLLAQDDARRRHGGHLRLPNQAQLVTAAGTWRRALRLAGLASGQGYGGQRSRVQPVSAVEALERCFVHHGTQPTSLELDAFAKANGIPTPRREDGVPWSEYLCQWKDGRRAQGLNVPAGPPPKAERPDYTQDIGAALPGERRRKSWTEDEVVAWVADYLTGLAGRDSANVRAYDAWAQQRENAPGSTRFAKFGGWSAVVAIARKWSAKP